MLQESANRPRSYLRSYLRSYDLIGRAGDDEFLVAVPGFNSQEALHLAGRVRTILFQRAFSTDAISSV